MTSHVKYLTKRKEVSMNEGFIETVKEGARLTLFAAVSFFVTWLLQQFGTMDQTNTNIVVLTAVLRLVDKFLFTSGVAKSGLSRF